MKLNYELIKKLLTQIEGKSDGNECFQITSNDIDNDIVIDQKTIDYHLQILEDDDLVDIQTRLDGVTGTTMINRLTAEGHRVLEAMQNDSFWNKLKGETLGAGKDILKNIPSMFIKMVISEALK